MSIRMARVSAVVTSAVIAVGVANCSDAPTDPVSGQPEVHTISPAQSEMDAQTREIARYVALALSDESVRADIWRRIQESPYPEHKLEFRDLFINGSIFGDRVVAISALERPQLLDRLDRLVPLEFYMPVPEHREKWKGGADLLVATTLRDDEAHTPVGFTLDGEMVHLDRRNPPERPALVVVPAETNFDAPAPTPSMQVAASTITGIWASKIAVWEIDRWEGWLAGNPEFEVHTYILNEVYGDWRDETCAGERRSGYIYFDYNSGTWYGNLLVGSEELIGERDVEFQLWEDDADPCEINGGRPPKTTSATLNDVGDFASAIVSVVAAEGTAQLQALIKAIPAAYDFATNFLEDEYVGTILWPAGACWPDTSSALEVPISEAGITRGTATLDNTFGVRTPLCELSVDLAGPSQIETCAIWPAPDPDPLYTAYVSGGTGTISRKWYEDGDFVGTSSTYELSDLNPGQHVLEVWVTRGTEEVMDYKIVTVTELDPMECSGGLGF